MSRNFMRNKARNGMQYGVNSENGNMAGTAQMADSSHQENFP